jgi:hypothetical protein
LQFMGQLAGMGDDAGGEIELRTAWVKAQEMAQERKEFEFNGQPKA